MFNYESQPTDLKKCRTKARSPKCTKCTYEARVALKVLQKRNGPLGKRVPPKRKPYLNGNLPHCSLGGRCFDLVAQWYPFFYLVWFWVPLSSSQPAKRVPLSQFGYWATKLKNITSMSGPHRSFPSYPSRHRQGLC